MFELPASRRQFLRTGALVATATAMPGWAFARTNAGGWPTVQALLDSYAPSPLAGVAAAVARGTDDADFMVAGTIARGSKRAVDADTLFRVYSMTKPITAMAAMMLVEDGKIGLDQDVGDFIPGFKKPMVVIDQMVGLDARPATRPVTIRGLLTHTSGLGYIITSKGKLLEAYAKAGLTGGPVSRFDLPGLPKIVPAPDLKTFADRIAELPLNFEPATRWSYSAGLDVMGRVIEVASGMGFEAFLKQRLFDPLGMTSTWFRVPASELPRLTTNYGIAGDSQIPIDPGATSVFADAFLPLGGGGLVMSPRDYDRFLLMLAGYGAVGRTRVMKEATVRLAMSNLLPPTVDTKTSLLAGQGFGAGGRVTTVATPGGANVGTYGWGGAAATIAFVDPAAKIRASGFAQYMPDQARSFTKDFAKSVYAGL